MAPCFRNNETSNPASNSDVEDYEDFEYEESETVEDIEAYLTEGMEE